MADKSKYARLAEEVKRDADFNGMADEDFSDLVESLEEAGKIIAEKKARVSNELHPAKIRRHMRLSQEEFAGLIGVRTSTLRNWEQGRVRIPAVAQTLFRIVREHPETLIK